MEELFKNIFYTKYKKKTSNVFNQLHKKPLNFIKFYDFIKKTSDPLDIRFVYKIQFLPPLKVSRNNRKLPSDILFQNKVKKIPEKMENQERGMMENPAEDPWQATESAGEIEKLHKIIEEKNEEIQSLLEKNTRMVQIIQVFEELLKLMDQIMEVLKNGREEI
jgi:hypothetical protein